MQPKSFRDLTGLKFGRWCVINRGPNHGEYVRWNCICDCGHTRLVQTRNLVGGLSQSCGCLASELAAARSKKQIGTPEYIAWQSMKQRCNNPNASGYENYGGRGIRVCEQWENSFEIFLADVGNRPSKSHSLDRYPNQDGNYEPGNVRWATRKEQNTNTRHTKMISFGGVTLCAKDWAKRLGVSYDTFLYRFHHWPLEKAMASN